MPDTRDPGYAARPRRRHIDYYAKERRLASVVSARLQTWPEEADMRPE
jgi:hypothetical protein